MRINKTKEEKGITLVALIITIIILIILSAVVISKITDMNIVTLVAKSAEDYSSKQVEEEKSMDNLSTYLDKATGDKEQITIDKEEYDKLKELEKNNGKLKIIHLGDFNSLKANTIDVSKYEGYENFKIENFMLGNVSMKVRRANSPDDTIGDILKSYDPQTGKLYTRVNGDCTSGWNCYIIYSVYLLVGEIENEEIE